MLSKNEHKMDHASKTTRFFSLFSVKFNNNHTHTPMMRRNDPSSSEEKMPCDVRIASKEELGTLSKKEKDGDDLLTPTFALASKLGSPGLKEF